MRRYALIQGGEKRPMRYLRAAMATAAILTGSAFADTILVPDDYPTIQEAVDAAVNGDEILVAEGTYVGSGESVVEIVGKSITLRASNAAPGATIIDGLNERRGIDCFGSKTSGTVIEGFTIIDGQADQGGAVSIRSCDVTVMDCTMTDNSASSSGGALYCTYGDVNVSNCQFMGNDSAGDGGGLFVRYCTTTFSNCDIMNNTANLTGGGLYLRDSDSSLVEMTIEGNASATSGGGMLLFLSQCSMEACTFNANTATTGAGLRVLGLEPCSMTNCTITNNQASEGGGGMECATANPVLVDTIACGNSPQNIQGIWTDEGGNCTTSYSCQDSDQDGLPDECFSVGDGLHEVPAEFPTIQDAVIAAGNSDTILVSPGTWTGTGDAVINTNGKQLLIKSTSGPNPTILDGEDTRSVIKCVAGESEKTSFEGFTITGGSGFLGGGILCIASSPRFINCRIIHNTANDFGAGFYSNGGSPVLENCIFRDNLAQNNGGGIYCFGGSPVIINCDVSENAAVDGGGGMTLIGSNGVIDNCTITSNGTGGPGGGVECNQSNATFNACTITNNATMMNGGGVASEDDSSTFIDCVISENIAGDGGAMTLQSCTTSITNCLMQDNTATMTGGLLAEGGAPKLLDSEITGNLSSDSASDGGGIRLSFCNMELTNCVIAGNICGQHGGGILAFNSDASLTNCELIGNQSKSGGGLYCNQSDVAVLNCSFSSNDADIDGGGFFATSCTPTVSGSRFNGNRAGADGAGIYLVNSSPLVSDCLIHDNIADGNFSDGGGIHCYASDAEFDGCTIWNNDALIRGGGLFCRIGSSPVITNCTFATNSSGSGGGIYSLQNDPFIADSKLCGNSPVNIEGPYVDGEGNTIQDTCKPDCLGDVDGNGAVDVNDVLAMVSAWNTANYDADLDGDGLVDADDVLILLSQYGETCP